MEAPMRTTLVLEGLAVLAAVILLLNASWQSVAKNPEEDAP